MPLEEIPVYSFTEAINRGFSKQSIVYDEADHNNKILTDLRRQVYVHVEAYLKPESHILEINAGTGLDAQYFVSKGHRVHATDLSDGMVAQMRSKISLGDCAGRFTCQQVSFEDLDQVPMKNFDYVFSNFGGLNCIRDLSLVTRHLPLLLRPGGYITWVIMPPVCPWELLSIFKGKWRQVFRRWNKNGTLAHVEGEYFTTYYHSLKSIRFALGPSFSFVKSEGLASLSPPPHRSDLPSKHPGIYRMLRKLDRYCRNRFPFNRWGDHIIVTFQYRV